ncbi:GNAT family N-acetyltransferase [Undibacterium sp. Di24W]|uniref:GNAT family N-acetyltransferase n=1 Tax=Undibacterium sp. Di24W TaxID=3413033 RepID=UPI003BF1C2D5
MLDLISPLAMRLVHSEDQNFLDVLFRDRRPDLLALPLPPNALTQMISMQQMSQSEGVKWSYPSAQDWVLCWGQDAIGRLIVDVGADVRLIDIAVLSSWRKRGIATHVLKALQVHAAGIDKSISLAVQCDNQIARRVYQKAGFVLRSSDSLFDQMIWQPAET